MAGAIFSGFAMVQTLLIIMRKVSNLESYITVLHIEYMNKVILLTGGIVTVAYITEYFIGWYSGVPYENYTYLSFGAATGPYWWAFWALITCNLYCAAFTLGEKIKKKYYVCHSLLLLLSNIGMWFERFDIIVVDLSKDRLTFVLDHVLSLHLWILEPLWEPLDSSLCFSFCTARTFPVIAQAEVKTILKSSGESVTKIYEKDGDSLVGTGSDPRTSQKPANISNAKKEIKTDTKSKPSGSSN